MISFNSLGYESMTGEPNTWNPRVSLEGPLPEHPTLKGMSSRGLDAAFRIWESKMSAATLDLDAKTRQYLEEVRGETQQACESLMEYDQHNDLNWHQEAKLRRAKRRETNARHKDRFA